MTELILKKDWKDLIVEEWEGILEDVSEVSTKFEYRTFTVAGERAYEFAMKNDGKICGRWTGNKLALLKGCSACHKEIIEAYLTGYCAGAISNRLSLIQKVSDCGMWMGMEPEKQKKERKIEMLFTKRTKENVMDVCDSIMDGTELTMEQLDAAFLFSSEVNDKIEKKIVVVLEMVYPSMWEDFCELDNFDIYDGAVHFTYANSDNQLIASVFPFRLLGLSKAELKVEA